MAVSYVDKAGLTYFVGKVKTLVSNSINDNTVKYSGSQSLTDSNKQQARTNVGINYSVEKTIED